MALISSVRRRTIGLSGRVAANGGSRTPDVTPEVGPAVVRVTIA
jgi:hypothetical protein